MSPREEIKLLKGNSFLWQVFLWGKKPQEIPIHLSMTCPAIVRDPPRILPPEFSPDSTVALSAWGSVSELPLPVSWLLVMWDSEVGFVKVLGSLSGPNFIVDSWRLETQENEDRKPLCFWLPSCPPLFPEEPPSIPLLSPLAGLFSPRLFCLTPNPQNKMDKQIHHVISAPSSPEWYM